MLNVHLGNGKGEVEVSTKTVDELRLGEAGIADGGVVYIRTYNLISQMILMVDKDNIFAYRVSELTPYHASVRLRPFTDPINITF